MLHSFSGLSDGAHPFAGLVLDTAGNLYGTTQQGGAGGCGSFFGCGTVFKLDKTAKETVLYRFPSGVIAVGIPLGVVPPARSRTGAD